MTLNGDSPQLEEVELLVDPKWKYFSGWSGVMLKERGALGTRNPSIKEMLLDVSIGLSEWATLLFDLFVN